MNTRKEKIMSMKKSIVLGGWMVLAAGAQATLLRYNYNGGAAAVPDGNPVGIAESIGVNDIPAQLNGQNAVIQSVEVRLDITGGYNGDLYGYLVLQSNDGSTATALLLNRVGTSAGAGFGSAGAGFNVALGDSGTANGDIHLAAGVPTGEWLADQSAGANSLNTAFEGKVADGTWTLFLADLAAGDQSTVMGWGLNISVVPEPVTAALAVFAGLGAGWGGMRRWKHRQ